MDRKCSAKTRRGIQCARNVVDEDNCRNEYCTQHKKMYELMAPLRTPAPVKEPKKVQIRRNSLNHDKCFLCLQGVGEPGESEPSARFDCGHQYHVACGAKHKITKCTLCVHQCCCCLEDVANLKMIEIKCNHLVCEECFKQLRKPICPICNSELESKSRNTKKLIAAIRRRADDDKEKYNTQFALAMLQLERLEQLEQLERDLEQRRTVKAEIVSFAVEVLLSEGIDDTASVETAMGMMRSNYTNICDSLLLEGLEEAFVILGI
jgi:hypothetical protein